MDVLLSTRSVSSSPAIASFTRFTRRLNHPPERRGLVCSGDGYDGLISGVVVTGKENYCKQVLALACGARTILEIGALAGYSGVWLARALPPNGKLISLEVSPKHAEVVRATFAAAGLSDRAEVRVGSGLDLLPTLVSEAPFDLIFIDADKENYPQYLDWAITLSQVGSLIVADNVIRGGSPFQTPPPDENTAGIASYNRKILEHPRLVSVAFPNDDDGMDGFAISVVRG